MAEREKNLTLTPMGVCDEESGLDATTRDVGGGSDDAGCGGRHGDGVGAVGLGVAAHRGGRDGRQFHQR